MVFHFKNSSSIKQKICKKIWIFKIWIIKIVKTNNKYYKINQCKILKSLIMILYINRFQNSILNSLSKLYKLMLIILLTIIIIVIVNNKIKIIILNNNNSNKKI